MTVEILEPHGFCAGVTNALRKALTLKGASLYCLHELVHNEIVVSDLKRRGFTFVESVEEVPEGATVLFSAHGVSPAVRAAAAARHLKVIDATCPFVTRVHQAAKDFAARGLPVVILGHPNHAEVKGIMGEVEGAVVIEDVLSIPGEATGTSLQNKEIKNSNRSDGDVASPKSGKDVASPIGVVSQTTMNADEVAEMVAELRKRYAVETMAEVCHATKERQDAVKRFDGDALLVLGSANSSNTKRLCEVARCRTFRAGTLDEVKALDFAGVRRLGVTSGASTPESFFREVVSYLKSDGDVASPNKEVENSNRSDGDVASPRDQEVEHE